MAMSLEEIKQMARSQVDELPNKLQQKWYKAKFEEILEELMAKIPTAAHLAGLETQIAGVPEIDELHVPRAVHDKLGISSWSYSNPQQDPQKIWLAQFFGKLEPKLKEIEKQSNEMTKFVEGIKRKIGEIELEDPLQIEDVPSKFMKISKDQMLMVAGFTIIIIIILIIILIIIIIILILLIIIIILIIIPWISVAIP